MFAKKGLRLLLIAKFVPGLDGICPPLAGMLGASRTAFLLHDAAGATLWAAVYISFGFIFAKQLDQVAQHISAVATLVVLIFGIPLLLLFGLKLTQLILMIRLLRSMHILPDMLKSRLDSGKKVGIIDLLRFEEDPEGVAAIPGALRLDPLELRRKKRVMMPPVVDLVLYCRSKNSFVSARVAAVMRKHGIHSWLAVSRQLVEPRNRGDGQAFGVNLRSVSAWRSMPSPRSTACSEAVAGLRPVSRTYLAFVAKHPR